MNLFEWITRGRFGAAIRAGAGFVTVSIIGAVVLVVLAIVLWAASLTPFGLWAALPVIAAGAIVALVLWWRERPGAGASPRHSAVLGSSAGAPGLPDDPAAEAARRPNIRLIGLPGPQVPRVRRKAPREPRAPDAEDLKRTFDQAFAAGRFDEAETALTELARMPGQIDWTRRKQRLVSQQRARG
jgi:hypothetical protein